LQMYKRF